MNDAQSHGLPAAAAAQQVLALAEQVLAPTRVPIGKDAEQALKTARVATDAEMDQVRLQMMGLAEATPMLQHRWQSPTDRSGQQHHASSH